MDDLDRRERLRAAGPLLLVSRTPDPWIQPFPRLDTLGLMSSNRRAVTVGSMAVTAHGPFWAKKSQKK